MSTKPSKVAAAVPPIHRRAFLGTAGALVAASLAPLSISDARDLGEPALDLTPGLPPGSGAESANEWDVDDMWGHRPRYAHPIPHGPARTSPVLWEHVDPVDCMLVI